MNLIDNIEKLSKLVERGLVTEEEFIDAKRVLLEMLEKDKEKQIDEKEDKKLLLG